MAITEDASSPAAVHVSGAQTGTTGSFTPPAGTQILVRASVDGNANQITTATISDSQGHTYTKLIEQHPSDTIVGGSCVVAICDNASAVGTTVTVAWSGGGGANDGNIVVKVLNGALPTASQNGATGGATLHAGTLAVSITPHVIGSRVYGACSDYTTNATLTANSNTTIDDQFNDAGVGDTWAVLKGSGDVTSLSSTSYGSTTTNDGFIAVAEILAAAGGGPAPAPAIGPGMLAPGSQFVPWIGTGSDSTTASPTLTDTGSAADALAVTATIPLADTGSASDALAVAVAVPLADAGSGSDALALTATVPLSDSGAGADAIGITATVPLTDAGSGADSMAAGVPIGVSDSGSASDAFAVTATVPLAETGTASDALAVTVTLAVTDAGTAADTLAVLVSLAQAEAGSALDALGVTAAVPLPQSASGADAISVNTGGATTKVLTDTGSAFECVGAVLMRQTSTTARPDSGITTRPNNGITC